MTRHEIQWKEHDETPLDTWNTCRVSSRGGGGEAAPQKHPAPPPPPKEKESGRRERKYVSTSEGG